MSTPWIGPDGQLMRRLEFHITYHCPEKCAFCSEEHRMQAFSAFPVNFGRVATVLREHAARGVEHVHFTGGEPTIHPQFPEILRLSKKLGLRTSMGTIGTRLADPLFAEKVLPFLDEALFSIHGATASTHDGLTRRNGSFGRLLRALEHARAFPEFRIYANTVLTTENREQLPDITRFVREQGARLQVISNLTPEGSGEDFYSSLAVRLSDITELAPKVIEAAGSMIVRFFGVPLCSLGAHAFVSNDLYWNPRVTVEWTRQPGKVVLDGIYSWTPERRRKQGETCSRCPSKGLCFGVFDRYLERFGEQELTPVEV